MHHLFLPLQAFLSDGTAQITGLDFRHLSTVLRMREGERIVLLDGNGNAWQSVLKTITKSMILAEREEVFPLPPELGIEITVAQALGKGDKFEQVLQHGTEVGASAFRAISAERSVVEVPASKVAERVERWRLIAKGASEQSKRSRIPKVSEPLTLPELLRGTEGESVALLHTSSDAVPLKRWLLSCTQGAALTLCIGPEGGWSEREVSASLASNVTPVSLGHRVLRTETAALVALSQISYQMENQ